MNFRLVPIEITYTWELKSFNFFGFSYGFDFENTKYLFGFEYSNYWNDICIHFLFFDFYINF